MKFRKFIGCVLSFALLIAISATVAACGKKKDPEKPQTSLSLSESSVEILFGETYAIVADYAETESETLVWSSEDESVATVQDGLITAAGRGNTKIIATYGEAKAECEVSVNFGEFVPELKLRHIPEGGLRLKAGATFAIEAYVLFNGKSYSCTVSAEIADAAVASYAEGVLTAKGAGVTQVTLKTSWNSFENALTEKTFTLEVF